MTETLISLLTGNKPARGLIASTAAKTGFTPELIEKDLYLTILLEGLMNISHPLVFKGGTCLNKCYLGFYRLSEDLDFIHIDAGIGGRGKRKADLGKLEDIFASLVKPMDGIMIKDIGKFDLHQQLRVDIEYPSKFSARPVIKCEVTHRHRPSRPFVEKGVNHLFSHPVTGDPYAVKGKLRCIDFEEAVAEKIRACLTRKEPAIRDFFDLWYIREREPEVLEGESIKKLVTLKLEEIGSRNDLTSSRPQLVKQIKVELEPTLNKTYPFNLEDAIRLAESFINPQ